MESRADHYQTLHFSLLLLLLQSSKDEDEGERGFQVS